MSKRQSRQTEYNIPSWGIFEASASKHGIALRWGHSIFNFEALRTHSCWGVARGRGSYPSSIGRPRPPCWLRTEVSVQSTRGSAISTKRKRSVFANEGWRWNELLQIDVISGESTCFIHHSNRILLTEIYFSVQNIFFFLKKGNLSNSFRFYSFSRVEVIALSKKLALGEYCTL